MRRSSRTPFVILGLLGASGQRPRSGYEIKKAIATVIASFWHESDGQLYPALKALAAAGEIAVRAEASRGRRRTLYAITPLGRKRLRAWLAAPVAVGRPRDELTLKMFFGGEGELADLIRHVEVHRQQAEAALAQCRQWDREAGQNRTQNQPFLAVTARAGVRHSEAQLRWAEETLEVLTNLGAHANSP